MRVKIGIRSYILSRNPANNDNIRHDNSKGMIFFLELIEVKKIQTINTSIYGIITL